MRRPCLLTAIIVSYSHTGLCEVGHHRLQPLGVSNKYPAAFSAPLSRDPRCYESKPKDGNDDLNHEEPPNLKRRPAKQPEMPVLRPCDHLHGRHHGLVSLVAAADASTSARWQQSRSCRPVRGERLLCLLGGGPPILKRGRHFIQQCYAAHTCARHGSCS